MKDEFGNWTDLGTINPVFSNWMPSINHLVIDSGNKAILIRHTFAFNDANKVTSKLISRIKIEGQTSFYVVRAQFVYPLDNVVIASFPIYSGDSLNSLFDITAEIRKHSYQSSRLITYDDNYSVKLEALAIPI